MSSRTICARALSLRHWTRASPSADSILGSEGMRRDCPGRPAVGARRAISCYVGCQRPLSEVPAISRSHLPCYQPPPPSRHHLLASIACSRRTCKMPGVPATSLRRAAGGQGVGPEGDRGRSKGFPWRGHGPGRPGCASRDYSMTSLRATLDARKLDRLLLLVFPLLVGV